MRLKQRDWKYGDRRMVTKFLLFPKSIHNETRWLERTTFVQKFVCYSSFPFLNVALWDDHAWADREPTP